MEEAGGDCAVYVDPNQPEALAAAMMNVLENTGGQILAVDGGLSQR